MNGFCPRVWIFGRNAASLGANPSVFSAEQKPTAYGSGPFQVALPFTGGDAIQCEG